MQLGFAGMGIMGSAMARNLLRAGHAVSVWNRTASKCEPLAAEGAAVAASLPELARAADIVFICVADTPDVEAVLFGPQGLVEGLGPGKIVVDHSTISPEATVAFAERVNALGAAYLDAPVSGGETGAINATLTIMVGGEAAVLEQVRPYLAAMGRSIVHCGPQGSGQKVKAVNQVICALNILATSEGMLLAKRMGLDLEVVHRVVSSGAAASWMLSNLGPKMIANDFAPGFMIKLQAKDLRIAAASIEALGGGLPGTALTHRLFDEAVAAGLGEQGTQGLVNLLGWNEA
ncbi:MAG: NAD(P)-dependent oxidoreductase [Armatimonadetes bacterium]|nr:NAD(P)-dependent oxidoreductase [Armatimonadota bacterium]NPV49270.1 NAD(P)-dependent oxidoreductase [Armatimonadota bacterium]